MLIDLLLAGMRKFRRTKQTIQISVIRRHSISFSPGKDLLFLWNKVILTLPYNKYREPSNINTSCDRERGKLESFLPSKIPINLSVNPLDRLISVLLYGAEFSNPNINFVGLEWHMFPHSLRYLVTGSLIFGWYWYRCGTFPAVINFWDRFVWDQLLFTALRRQEN